MSAVVCYQRNRSSVKTDLSNSRSEKSSRVVNGVPDQGEIRHIPPLAVNGVRNKPAACWIRTDCSGSNPSQCELTSKRCVTIYVEIHRWSSADDCSVLIPKYCQIVKMPTVGGCTVGPKYSGHVG